MANVLPRDLDAAASVPADAAVIVDNGVTVEKATPAQIVEVGRPQADQATAEAGVDNAMSMSPLRTRQAIIALSPLISGNVAATLADLKTYAVSANTVLYDSATFKWTLGDYSGQADDVNIIKADSTALSVGAWLRQSADKITTETGSTAQEALAPHSTGTSANPYPVEYRLGRDHAPHPFEYITNSATQAGIIAGTTTTDVSSELQAMLDGWTTTDGKAGIEDFPVGVFALGSRLLFPNWISWRGQGRGTQLKLLPDHTGPIAFEFNSDPTQNTKLSSVTVTNQGSGYASPPAVVFAGGGSNIGKVMPTATAVLGTGGDAGKVVSISVDTQGAFLDTAPTISFTGGGGSAAAATANMTTPSARFNNRLIGFDINCNNAAAVDRAIYAPSWNEKCGLYDVLMRNVPFIALEADEFHGGSSGWSIEHCEFMFAATAIKGFRLAGKGRTGTLISNRPQIKMNNVSIVGGAAPAFDATDGFVAIENDNVHLQLGGAVHIEKAWAAVTVANKATLSGFGLTGSNDGGRVKELVVRGSDHTGQIDIGDTYPGSASGARSLLDLKAGMALTSAVGGRIQVPSLPGAAWATGHFTMTGTAIDASPALQGLSGITRISTGYFEATHSDAFAGGTSNPNYYVGGEISDATACYLVQEPSERTSTTFRFKVYRHSDNTLFDPASVSVSVYRKPGL